MCHLWRLSHLGLCKLGSSRCKKHKFYSYLNNSTLLSIVHTGEQSERYGRNSLILIRSCVWSPGQLGRHLQWSSKARGWRYFKTSHNFFRRPQRFQRDCILLRLDRVGQDFHDGGKWLKPLTIWEFRVPTTTMKNSRVCSLGCSPTSFSALRKLTRPSNSTSSAASSRSTWRRSRI